MKTLNTLMHLLFVLLIAGCASTQSPLNSDEQVKPTSDQGMHTTHRFQPLTLVMQTLLSNCKQTPALPQLDDPTLQQFINEFCATTSTNKQLKLIDSIKNAAVWPTEYEVWFDSLTWHTENLRKQKISNFYSDSKAQKHEQQLLELQRQLIELKQKLVDIEKQRLETSLSENRTQ